MKLKSALLSIGCAFTFQIACAQTDPINECLNFAEALNAASLTSPETAIARSELESAVANKDDVRSIRRPQVSSFLRTAAGDDGLVDSQFENQFGIRASQRLFDFGDTSRATRAADERIEAKQQAIEAAENDATLEVGLHYIEWMEAEQLLEVTGERAAYFRDKKNVLENAIEIGGATVAEVAEVTAELAIAEADRLDLELAKSNAAAALTWTLGAGSTPCMNGLAIAEGLFESVPGSASIDEWVITATGNNPTVESLKREASGLQIEAQRKARARLPKIDLVGTVSYAGNSEFGEFEYRDRIGVDVSVPLLSGSSINAKAREARSDAARASNELALLKRDLSLKLEQAYREVLILDAKTQQREAVLNARQAELEAVQSEFEAGVTTLSQQIESRLEYELAATTAIQTRIELLRTKLRLVWLSGGLEKLLESH